MAVPDITAEIAAFRDAAYGEDVRSALIQLAQKLRGVITSELNDMSATWNSYKTDMDNDWSDLQETWNTYKDDWSDLQDTWAAYQSSMNGSWSSYKNTLNNAWTNYKNEIDSNFEKGLAGVDLIKYYDTNTYPVTHSASELTINKNNNTFHISGMTPNRNFFNIIQITVPNTGIDLNSQLYLEYYASTSNTILQVYYMNSSNAIIDHDEVMSGQDNYKVLQIRPNTIKITIRFYWTSSTEIDEDIILNAFSIPNFNMFSSYFYDVKTLSNNSNLNDFTETSRYLLSSSNTYTNRPPITGAGMLIVQKYSSNIALQCFIQFSTMQTFLRRSLNSTWIDWKELSKDAIDNVINKIDSDFEKRLTGADLIKYYDTNTYPATHSQSGLIINKSNNIFHISGTTLRNTFFNIIGITVPNTGIDLNSQLYLEYYANTSKTILQVYYKDTSSNTIIDHDDVISGRDNYKVLKIRPNTTQIIIRFYWTSSTEIDEDIKLNVFSIPNLNMFSSYFYDVKTLSNNSNLNDFTETSRYLLSSSNTYINLPPSITGAGMLIVQKYSSNIALQCFIQFSTMQTFLRRSLNSTWIDWKELSTSQSTTNSYVYNNYRNEYTVNATPTITTSSNNYLSSTNNNTDRTADILALLNTTGVCNLGPGIFYVNDLVMPDETTINGSGEKTKIILGNSGTFALSFGIRCRVYNLTIRGNSTDISRPSEIGNRNGILVSGDYQETSDNNHQPFQGMISNIRIRSFTGSGILFTNTGFASASTYLITNVYCDACAVGINVAYWSEFHKFTNVRAANCLYGCINNGGNNVFMNCDFSSNTAGMLMDNTSNQSPNNSHGSVIGCVFNHTNNNTGIGIEIIGNKNGEIFDGCQIFFSQIRIINSDGIVFSNCNFGQNNTDITIADGGTILFANNMHQAMPNISITNNANVHFSNCYVRSTGAVVAPS